MIYLHRYTTADEGDTSVEIAAVEEAGHAERYEKVMEYAPMIFLGQLIL